MYEALKAHLLEHKKNLIGDWVRKNCAYDEYICDGLNMALRKSRYWDAEWNDLHLEFKKGRSIWLDLVRYGEIVLEVSGEASVETLTLFFLPTTDKHAIEEIIVAETRSLISRLRLTEEMARSLVRMKQTVPRSLNAQASLTVNDVKEMSVWTV